MINPSLVVTVVVTQTFTGTQSTTKISTIISTSIPSTGPPTSTQSQLSPTSTSSTGLSPIVRPTVTSSASPVSTDTGSCPTGFYACSAYYGGGCCQTDRACNTYSCPPTSSSTIVSGQATIVVPVGSAATVATPTGPCAGGWSTCPASVGGNCCLSGWECGTASCTSVSASETDIIQKASPQKSAAGNVVVRGSVVITGAVLSIAFVLF